VIQLQSVCKRYGNVTAVDDCDLQPTPSATTVLIGPSGCGKSTLLRLIVGLEQADSGRLTLDGKLLGVERSPTLRHRMGYVIQNGGLFPHLTVHANIAIVAEHLGWARARVEERVDYLTGLTDFPRSALERYPLELSGGQQQRVGLMRALMLDPEWLLLDEPLGALDPMIRFDLQQQLRTIFAELGKSVILVTHDLAEAAFFAGEIVLMREGKIVQRGTISELLERPADEFVQRFVRAQRRLGEGG
jgi:osmoprotectant transport system ATP-binding protein